MGETNKTATQSYKLRASLQRFRSSCDYTHTRSPSPLPGSRCPTWLGTLLDSHPSSLARSQVM